MRVLLSTLLLLSLVPFMAFAAAGSPIPGGGETGVRRQLAESVSDEEYAALEQMCLKESNALCDRFAAESKEALDQPDSDAKIDSTMSYGVTSH